MHRNAKLVLILILLSIGVVTCGPEATEQATEPSQPSATETSRPPATESNQAPATESNQAPASETTARPPNPDMDALFQDSYNQLLLRDPELITELGLADLFGAGNDQLTNISDSYRRETQQLESAILTELNGYDQSELSPEQQLSADIYAWYLSDLAAGHEFMYNDYLVVPLIIGIQNQLVQFFTDIHPINDLQDAQDYLARLSQVDSKIEQLLEGLELRQQAGVVLPKFIIRTVLRDLRGMVYDSARRTPFYTAFENKVITLPGVNDAEKQALLTAAENEIGESVLPAFQALVHHLEQLEGIATDDAGVWKFPNGEEYYAYALRHHTTTDMTADEIHELGLQEVERIQAEIRLHFDELNYPQDEGLPDLFNRVARDGGSLSASQVVAGYEAIISKAEQKVGAVFDLQPSADVIVVGGPIGGYYMAPAIDGSRPGAFYARVNGSEPKFGMPTLAYHEAVPGHHFQIAIAQELDLPSFRHGVHFTAYAEGWALYAERLAWELGLYEGDPYGNLGRLQAEAFRAVRLVVDTGIHAKRWTYDQAVAYMLENTGLSRGMVEFEIARYITWPGQATAYKIGMIKILELRQRAMDQLGGQFDLIEFHNVILGNGAMPLAVLERVVQDYIDARLTPTSSAGDGVVEGWAVLAEKDDYSDVGMSDLPVDYIGITQMRQVLANSGWHPDQIHELRGFDRETLQDNLAWLAENADQDDIIFFYISSHGQYLREVLVWDEFFAADWEQILSHRRLLVIDSCQAATYTGAVAGDPAPYLSIAAVAGDEYSWSGLEEEGLPIIGGVFTHYFAAAFGDPSADADNDGFISAQEAALLAEEQQRAYMHEVVFAEPEFLDMYHSGGIYPDQDPTFPHVVADDTIGEPLLLALDAYP